MFAGIIEAKGRVANVHMRAGNRVVRIGKPAAWKFKNGESVSIDGICSTVIASTATSFTVEYMPQSLRITTAKLLQKGSVVNMERSLKYGDRIHGHYVQGHIDGVGKVTALKKRGADVLLSVQIPNEVRIFVTPRGSISLNGVSLTVASYAQGIATVALIPHTLKYTNLGQAALVNVETDLIARYQQGTRKRARVPRNATKALR